MTIDGISLGRAVLALLDEAYVGPRDPRGTWFTDNEEGSGFLGTVAGLDAEAASKPLAPGDPLTAASHAGHLLFALSLANRAARGENPYEGAVWARSWDVRGVDDASWAALLADLRREHGLLRANVEKGAFFGDEAMLTGILAMVAHGAWHLGALRQALGRVRAPGL